jgi:hypothetical protein
LKDSTRSDNKTTTTTTIIITPPHINNSNNVKVMTPSSKYVVRKE